MCWWNARRRTNQINNVLLGNGKKNARFYRRRTNQINNELEDKKENNLINDKLYDFRGKQYKNYKEVNGVKYYSNDEIEEVYLKEGEKHFNGILSPYFE